MSDQPASTPASETADAPPTWRGGGGMSVTVVPSGDGTRAGRQMAFLFDDLTADIQGNGPMVAVCCAAVAATANVGEGMKVRIRHTLRGQVSKDPDARATVVADLGGTPLVMEFPFGAGQEEPIARDCETVTELRPGQRYLMSVMISAERRSRAAGVILALDGIDVEIVPADEAPGTGTGGAGEETGDTRA